MAKDFILRDGQVLKHLKNQAKEFEQETVSSSSKGFRDILHAEYSGIYPPANLFHGNEVQRFLVLLDLSHFLPEMMASRTQMLSYYYNRQPNERVA